MDDRIAAHRHTCAHCAGTFAPTKSGLVRGHWIEMDGPDGPGQYRCPGRGKAPMPS